MHLTHYVKCGVNISLHNSVSCRRSVVIWIIFLSRQTELKKRVIYKFTFLWLYAKQGTTYTPRSYRAHLCTVPFIWPREENRRQRSWVDEFVGQSGVMVTLDSQNIFCARSWGEGRSWFFPASSITFRNRRSLKSRWVIFSTTWR